MEHTCRTCAHFDKGICCGGFVECDGDRVYDIVMEVVEAGLVEVVYAGLTGAWRDAAATVINKAATEAWIRIIDPDNFYCSKWR